MYANIARLLAVALMCAWNVASANVIYNVNITDGVETVAGTITTNGASGLLTAADFVSWSLTASGPISFVDSGPPQPVFCEPPTFACGISAIGNQLVYNGANPAATFLYDGAVDEIAFASFDVFVAVDGGGGPYHIIFVTAPYVVGQAGQASAPEAPTPTLLGIGMVCLILAGKRARGRQPAVA